MSCVISFLGGAGMGVVMMIAQLRVGPKFPAVMYVPFIALSCAIPWCFDILKTHGFSVAPMEILMIVFSGSMNLILPAMVAENEYTFTVMGKTAILIHLPALAVTVIRHGIIYWNDRRTDDAA